LAVELRQWLASLWHGTALAYTIAVLALMLSSLLWFIGSRAASLRGSCTSSLRVNPAARKSSTMSPFTTGVRGLCHDIPSRFLPARADRCNVGVPDALWAVAIGAYGSSPADPQAAQATPHPLQRAQTLSGSHA